MRLYQYQPINKNTLQNLILQKIWASDPKSFNDPFEFVMRENYWVDNEGKVEYLKTEDQIALEEIKEATSKFGVTSFSECEDSVLLWSHYSSNHTGMCLTFEIQQSMLQNLFEVKYETIFPNMFSNMKNDLVRYLFTKGKYWEYEREHRLIFEKVGHYNYPGKLTEITFGCRSNKTDMESIFKICDTVFESEVLLSKASIDSNSFYLSKGTTVRKKGDPIPRYYVRQ